MKFPNGRFRSARRFAAGFFGLILAAAPAALIAQSDDFNDGNDTGWTRYAPLGSFGVPGFFSFPNGGYRLETRTATGNASNPGRIGSIRMDAVYTNFYLSVDVVDWKDNTRQAFGLLARLQNVGLGTTKGYAFTYERGSGVTMTSGATDISRITNEAPTSLPTGPDAYHMNPAKDYRFTFSGRGSALEGSIYELPNVTTPVLTISTTDSTYTNGVCGLVAYDNSGGLGVTDVTFDNYFAADIKPPRLTYEFNESFKEFILRWPPEYAGWVLQSTESLTKPITWTDLPSDLVDNQYYYIELAEPMRKFFRLTRP
ncbi:MAG: hypothetical protein QOF48_2238 [Verrucomicrobiota bacterium]|jgi:hypothetical protein